MYTVTDVLTNAKELISKGWTKKFLATDENGEKRWYGSEDATCFCSLGAISRAIFDLETDDPDQKFRLDLDSLYCFKDTLRKETSYIKVSFWNDSPQRTKEEVLEMFDKAIEASKKED